MTDDMKPIPSQCNLCKRRSTLSPFVCAAFPGTIPGEIRLNRHDHAQPWIDLETGEPGDQGIPLEGSILFEPKDDADPDALRSLRDYFNRPTI